MTVLGDPNPELTFGQKLRNTSWGLILLVCVTTGFGFAMLYSVAGGSIDPWVSRQMVRFGIGLTLMIAVAFIDLRLWLRLAYPFYGVALLLLVVVDLVGTTGQGAQRWVDLGPFTLQPSELMKIALVLALARKNSTEVVAYGTEAGQFQEAGNQAVICGPGSIAQAHKPNEFIELAEVRACETFMHRLLDEVCAA